VAEVAARNTAAEAVRSKREVPEEEARKEAAEGLEVANRAAPDRILGWD
jgi:hypothetical protein